MTKKIYVGNLPFSTTEEELSALFQEIGSVESVSIITDRDTGRSKGFGFVTMNDTDADAAIAKLNGQDFNGRAVTVNEARPMVKREFSNRGGR
jgi:RNA recognition motif-containing protein